MSSRLNKAYKEYTKHADVANDIKSAFDNATRSVRSMSLMRHSIEAKNMDLDGQYNKYISLLQSVQGNNYEMVGKPFADRISSMDKSEREQVSRNLTDMGRSAARMESVTSKALKVNIAGVNMSEENLRGVWEHTENDDSYYKKTCKELGEVLKSAGYTVTKDNVVTIDREKVMRGFETIGASNPDKLADYVCDVADTTDDEFEK